MEEPKIERCKTRQENKQKSPRYSDLLSHKLQNNSSYARLKATPPGMNLAS